MKVELGKWKLSKGTNKIYVNKDRPEWITFSFSEYPSYAVEPKGIFRVSFRESIGESLWYGHRFVDKHSDFTCYVNMTSSNIELNDVKDSFRDMLLNMRDRVFGEFPVWYINRVCSEFNNFVDSRCLPLDLKQIVQKKFDEKLKVEIRDLIKIIENMKECLHGLNFLDHKDYEFERVEYNHPKMAKDNLTYWEVASRDIVQDLEILGKKGQSSKYINALAVWIGKKPIDVVNIMENNNAKIKQCIRDNAEKDSINWKYEVV